MAADTMLTYDKCLALLIQFIKAPGQERYTPVLVLPDITDITRPPIKNEYEF